MPANPQLARFLEQARARKESSAQAVKPRPAGLLVRASEEQCQLWLHNEFADGAPIYNEPFALHFDCELNAAALERAFNYIVQRHEAWRTGFEWRDGNLVQAVAPELKIPLPWIDVSNLPPNKQERRAWELAKADSQLPIDLSGVPLFRVRLLRYSGRKWRLYMVIHHLVCDGVSIYQVFLPELKAAYEAFAEGREPDLTPLPFQYPDYSLWKEQKQAVGAELPHRAFWEEMLSGNLPTVAKLADRSWSEKRTYEAGIEAFTISAEVTGKIKDVGLSCNATLFMTLLSAFHVLLYAQADMRDQVIGSVTSGRKTPGCDRLLGYFVNTIPLRAKVLPDETFLELLRRTRDLTLNVLSKEVPFGELVNKFAKDREPGLNPLVQIMFSLEPATVILPDDWKFFKSDIDGFSKQDLDLQIGERDDGLTGRFTYRLDMFHRETAARMKQHWIELLAIIADDPNRSLEELAKHLRNSTLGVTESTGPKWLKWIRGRK